MITDKLPEMGDVIGRQNSVDEIILDISSEIKLDYKTKLINITTNFRTDIYVRIKSLDNNYYDITIDDVGVNDSV